MARVRRTVEEKPAAAPMSYEEAKARSADREAEIKRQQDAALAAVSAPVAVEKIVEGISDGIASVFDGVVGRKREAIPFENLPTMSPPAICGVCLREQRVSPGGPICANGHGGAPSEYSRDVDPRDVDSHASDERYEADVAASGGDAGETVTVGKGPEKYGRRGTFSSYDVAACSSTTVIRPGESRLGAMRRLRAELEIYMAEERVRARDQFLQHDEVAYQK